ncbi:inner membrane protein yiaW [Escherichia coli 3-105-05_S1_C2]|nr:inner membrane protein yiaW [Escherichia coli 3-105-05_S1_C2]
MFLDYFALGVLIFVFLVIFYGIIILHDIPYLIAKKRNHPHADAIHVAGWVSLFYVTCYLAVFVDLGHALPPGAGMGNAKP